MLWSILKKSPLPKISSGSYTEFPEINQQEGGIIICFSRFSEGEATKELLHWSVSPLRNQSAGVIVIDQDQSNWKEKLAEALLSPIWFVASPFMLGQDISVDRGNGIENIWEVFKVPFLRLYGDLPAYFPDAHLRKCRNSINRYYDKSHAIFYKRWFQDPALTLVTPFTVFDPLPLDLVDIKAKMAGKIIFPKNGNSPGQLIDYWRSSLPGTISTALENIAEECVATNQINLDPCLDERLIVYFLTIGIDIAAEPATVCFMVAQLDDYLRRVKSTLIAEAIIDLPVIIRGKFWSHMNFRGKRAVYDSNSNFSDTGVLIDRAPAVIDMSPNTYNSPHDRICRAASRGTAFLTNKQNFLNDLFQNQDEFCFQFSKDAIRACVESHVLNPRQAVELGLEQAKKIRTAYSPENYAKAMLTALQLCTMRLNGRPTGTQDFVLPAKAF